jgi:DNA-binding transcriptional regulator LsrR (DeoR family)
MKSTDVPRRARAGSAHDPLGASPADRGRLVRVSRRYYELGETQEEIARDMGITRPQVSKLLKQARDTGIVEIRILDPADPPADAAEAVRARFGLRAVQIAPSLASDELTRRRVGQLAATTLIARLRAGLTVGIGDGASMAAVADSMAAPAHPIDVVVVPLCGGYWGGSTSREPFRRIAEVVGGSVRGLLAPGLLDDRATRDALAAHAGIRAVTDLWERVDVAIFGIGGESWSEGTVGPATYAELERRRAIGEVLMAPFDAAGEFLETSLSARTLAMSPALLKRVPTTIGVASGAGKVPPILGALRSGVVGTLVTDIDTAVAVLRADDEERRGAAAGAAAGARRP